MMTLFIAGCIGGICGSAIRRGTPYFLRRKDKSKPFTWPWVELVSASAVMTVVSLTTSYGTWVLGAFFTFFLLAISATDFLCKLIPVRVVTIGTAVGILLNTLFPPDIIAFQSQGQFLNFISFTSHLPMPVQGLILSCTGALFGFVTLEFLRRVIGSATHMEVMGMGDSLILMLIGAFIGPKMVLLSILPASIIGVLIGLYFKWVKGSPHSPFGPALALGGWLQMLFWHRLDSAIDRFYFLFYSLPSWMMSIFAFSLLIILFLLILRIKKRASEYERMINEDYDSIEQEMED